MQGNQSREDLRRDLLTSLGHPILKVPTSGNDLIDGCINSALQQCRKWHPDFSYETHYLYQLTPDDVRNGYFIVPDYVESVIEVLPRGWGWSQLNFMNPSWQMAREVFLSYNQFVPLSLVDYTAVMQRLQNVSTILGSDVMPFNYARLQRRVFFYFQADAGDIIAMKVNEYIDPERTDPQAVDCKWVWNDEMLRATALAYFKIAIGRLYSKYNGIQLPGGVTLSGSQLLDEGNGELEDAIRAMKNGTSYGFVLMG